MAAPHAQSPAQSHVEVQKLLRAEIDALKLLLDERFAEIAALTTQLETLGGEIEAEAEHRVQALQKRHQVEITLLHVRNASWLNGPADGVPPFGRQIELISTSDLFDASWYLQTYADVSESGMSPKEHYVRSGAFEGRSPGPNFDTMSYYMANPDIAGAGWPALVHYAGFGQAEGRALA